MLPALPLLLTPKLVSGHIWPRLRPFGPPGTPLARMRWLFLVCNLLLLLGCACFIGVAVRQSVWHGLGAALSLGVLAWGRIAGYRRGGFSWRGHLVENAALLGMAFAFRYAEASTSAYFGGVFLLSLYGSARRVGAQAFAYVGLLAVAVLASGGDVSTALGPMLATRGTALLVLAALMRVLTSSLERHDATLAQLERALGREQALTRAGAAFAAAGNREQIYAAAVQIALELVPDDPTARAVLSLGSGDELTVVGVEGADSEGLLGKVMQVSKLRKPRDAADRAFDATNDDLAARERQLGFKPKVGGTIVAPLVPHGAMRGVLVLASDRALPPGTERSLDQLGVAAGLALDSLEAVEDRLRQKDERLRALVQHSSDVVSVVDAQGQIDYLSPSVERVFGHRAAVLVGLPLADLIHPDDLAQFETMLQQVSQTGSSDAVLECRVRHTDGSWRDTESRVTNLLHEPAIHGIVLNLRDVTERKTLEARLVEQAFQDPLTGLANRALFNDRAAHALARRERPDRRVGLLLLDLDNFKAVNDSLGHQAGDALLIEVARRLQACLRPGDTVARLGGDEFAVLLEDLDQPGTATTTAERISRAMRAPLVLEASEVLPSASIGVAESGADESADALLRNADVALYAAKRQGIGRIERFQQAMHAATFERLSLSADLRRAVEHDEFEVYYQPITRLETGQVLGFESLVRWTHPERGLVSPADFIPLAEETGLIVPLGRLVLRESCRQLRAWQQAYPELSDSPLTVSVNLSARQLQDPQLVDDIDAVLRETGLDPAHLVLEMTESLLLRDTDASIERLHALKELGVKLALDDFGTGYSSLSYLQRLPMDVLKIDKSFVDHVATSAKQTALISTILSLGRMLDLRTVAEGVEDPAQVEALRRMGCLHGQGYYFGRPQPAAATTALLARLAATTPGLPEPPALRAA